MVWELADLASTNAQTKDESSTAVQSTESLDDWVILTVPAEGVDQRFANRRQHGICNV
jgi:hypothetical protein